jgi:molybdenum cofactor cytidylyltransferase
MGSAKALLPIDDRDTFLSRIVRTFHEAGVARIVVVLGHDAAALIERLRPVGLSSEVVVNARYDAGQLSSLLTGLDAIESRADAAEVEGVLLMLVDAPLVAEETVRAVVGRYRATRAPIVRPVRGTEHGHPVLIDRSLFPLLRAADPTHGAKAVVRAHVSTEGDVRVDDDGAFLDIDTPEEYKRVFGRKLRRDQKGKGEG